MKPRRIVKEQRKHLRKHPDDKDARTQLAEALVRLGKDHEAAEEFAALAELHLEAGDVSAAAAACDRALAVEPQHSTAMALKQRSIAPESAAQTDDHAAVGSTEGGGQVEIRSRTRRKPRNRAAEAAAELAKQLGSGATKAAISPRLPQVLAEVASGMHLKQFSAGDLIVREGDPGDAIYLIVAGTARVLKADPTNRSGDLIEVAELGGGQIFGEFAVLADLRRHATVQAVEDCHVYEIPRAALDELVRTYPELAAELHRYYRRRLLGSLLSTSMFFQPLSKSTRERVLDRFEPVRYDPDSMIQDEGSEPTVFSIVLLGNVDVVQRTGATSTSVIRTLAEGDHFGSESLLRGRPSEFGILSRGPTEIGELAAGDFYDIVAANPQLWRVLREHAQAS